MAKRKAPKEQEAEPRPRQQHLEGMEPPVIKEIEDKAEEYVRVRN